MKVPNREIHISRYNVLKYFITETLYYVNPMT